jgi:hypothetical protein
MYAVSPVLKNLSELTLERTVTIAEPFLALHKETALYSAVGVGLYQCYAKWNSEETAAARLQKIAKLLLPTCASWYLSKLCPKYQPFMTGSVVLLTQLYRLWNLSTESKENSSVLFCQIASQVAQLASKYFDTPAAHIASLLVQTLEELTKAHQYNQTPEERSPEMCASIAMAVIRFYQASGYLSEGFIADRFKKNSQQPSLEIDFNQLANLKQTSFLDSSTKPSQKQEKLPKKTKAEQTQKQQIIPVKTTAEMAFGKAKWQQHFGVTVEELALPADIEDILNAPCPFWPSKKVRDTHILTLIPTNIGEQPLTLASLKQMIGKKDMYYTCHLGEYKDKPPTQTQWVLMSRNIIPQSWMLSYPDQKKRMPEGYQVPTVLQAVTSIIMHFVDTGNRLYPYTYTNCQEIHGRGYHLSVGEYSADGLIVYSKYPSKNVGVSAVKILSPNVA